MNDKATHLGWIYQNIHKEETHLLFIKMTAILLLMIGVATLSFTRYELTGTLYLLVLLTCLYHSWRVTEAEGFKGLYNHVRKLPDADIDFAMNHRAFKPKKLRPAILTPLDSLFYVCVLGIAIMSGVYLLANTLFAAALAP